MFTSGLNWGKLALKILIIPILAGAAVVTLMGFMSYTKYLNMVSVVNYENIYKNIRINGVDVGELSKAEALNKVTSVFLPDLESKTITVKSGDIEYVYHFDEFNVKLDFGPAVDQAYAYAREGTLDERYNKITALENAPYEITYEPKYSYDDSSAQDKVGIIADKVYAAPKNATIDRKDGRFIITKEEPGKELDAPATAVKVKQLLAENNAGVAEVVLKDVMPVIREDFVAQAQSLLGTFSTRFSVGQNGRNVNIINAAGKVNDQTLQPDEIFSTNAALGPSTEANGYAMAPVIVNGKLEDDFGGGVCQVSSTLYNAALYAELDIVERTSHSLKVGYLDYGFDATLAGDYLDLKFRNNTDLPVFLECYVEGDRLIANVYGKEIHGAEHSLSFHSELIERIKPSGEKITYDSTLPRGQRVVAKGATEGLIYALYKTVYENGEKVSTERVNISRYKAVPAEVRIGTGPIPEERPFVAAPDISAPEQPQAADVQE
ncbi:MAG: VanW family protein [Clostridiales bacterium]|jgi:vancomycin resistance protein YoaR|nr:VanW family protein [Clostridiales bacterium]